MGIGEDGLQQVEGLAADLIGLKVVGLLDEAGRRLFGLLLVDELLDLDRPHRLEGYRLQVLVSHDDVFVLGPFVAADRVRARDDLLVVRAPDLHLDPIQAGLVQHVEADAALLGGQVQLDRDGDQAELDRTSPHGSGHDQFASFFGCAPSHLPTGDGAGREHTTQQQACSCSVRRYQTDGRIASLPRRPLVARLST